MCQALYQVLCTGLLIYYPYKSAKWTSIIPILDMRKYKLREVKPKVKSLYMIKRGLNSELSDYSLLVFPECS